MSIPSNDAVVDLGIQLAEMTAERDKLQDEILAIGAKPPFGCTNSYAASRAEVIQVDREQQLRNQLQADLRAARAKISETEGQLGHLLHEVVEAFGYEDETWLHAMLHVKNAANSELARISKERDDAERSLSDARFELLVERSTHGKTQAEHTDLVAKLEEKTKQYEDLRFDMSLLRGALHMEPGDLAKLKQDKVRLDWVDANDKMYWESECRPYTEHHAFEVSSKKGQSVRDAIDAEIEEA